jgi:hypothetical protein
MTFGKDPRLIPDGKAVIEKFRAGKFEPEGYTLTPMPLCRPLLRPLKPPVDGFRQSQRMAESQPG